MLCNFGEASDKEPNRIRFVEAWNSKEPFMDYFEKSGEKLAQRVGEDGISLAFLSAPGCRLGAEYKRP